jgi:hypothetical protein
MNDSCALQRISLFRRKHGSPARQDALPAWRYGRIAVARVPRAVSQLPFTPAPKGFQQVVASIVQSTF